MYPTTYEHRHSASASIKISAAFRSFILHRHHSRHASGYASCSRLAGFDWQSLRRPWPYDRPVGSRTHEFGWRGGIAGYGSNFLSAADFHWQKNLFHKVG